jgi:hypothetical protein
MISSKPVRASWSSFALVVAIAAVSFGCSSKTSDTKGSAGADKEKKEGPDYEEVKLKSWLADVKKDKTAFTEKWRFKDIQFEGVVDDVLDSAPEHWVFIWPGTGEKGLDYPEIICMVKNSKEVAKWTKGDAVVAKGEVFGPMGLADNVQIFKCTLEKGKAAKGSDDDDKPAKKKKKSKDEDE